MIQLDDVYYSYEGLYTALRGVSLEIEDGERVAIMGSNGAGKTTLIKHMNGLLRPQRGHVFLDGRDTRNLSVAEMARIVGLVFQSPDHQLFLDSVHKEVVFGLKNLGFTSEEIEDRCASTLEHLGLTGFAERSPFTLSGGERKRVALACVLATEPRVLALDEPTIGQDAQQKDRLAQLLLDLNQKERTVIVVTHDIEFVIEHFPRTVAMADGRIVADGSTSSVLSNDKVIELCSLAHPQVTLAAKALRQSFPEVPERITSMSQIEEVIMGLLEGGTYS
ncbi:MAG: ABC transporter ATP-binding protein [Candidatus Thorarchaeota archaeon]|nr:MAG: ABC transporter ATP-binding protein [Candidatus Thorarchaeota archaeon]